MSKKTTNSKKGKSSSALVDDFSYLNMGEVEINKDPSKKGVTKKNRYDQNLKHTNSSKQLGFYFDGGNIENDSSLMGGEEEDNDDYFPDNNVDYYSSKQQQPSNKSSRYPPPLTNSDFMIPSSSSGGEEGRGGGESSNSYMGDHNFMENEDDEGVNYGGEYLDGGEEGEAEEGEEEIMAPEMPNEFYEQIDHFLKKPPPKIKLDDPPTSTTTDKSLKKKKITSKSRKADAVENAASYLPSIHQTSYDIYQNDYNVDQLPPPNMMMTEEDYEKGSNERRSGSGGDHKKSTVKKKKDPANAYSNPLNPYKDSKPRMIDSNLLNEAFAYTDQLLREAVIEEAQSMMNDGEAQKKQQYQDHQPRSAPADLLSATKKGIEETYGQQSIAAGGGGGGGGGGSKKKKSSSNRVGMVRNLKQKNSSFSSSSSTKPSFSQDNAFSVNTNIHDTEGPDLKRNTVNYDELIYNFQSGSTLDKLRKELAQSKQSLAQSENVIRELSGQYYSGKRK
jgi:hypothetical protein